MHASYPILCFLFFYAFIFQIVQYFFLRYTWILQQVPCYSCTYSGDRIGGSFLIFITSVCAYI